jgi:hypothetical protein
MNLGAWSWHSGLERDWEVFEQWIQFSGLSRGCFHSLGAHLLIRPGLRLSSATLLSADLVSIQVLRTWAE